MENLKITQGKLFNCSTDNTEGTRADDAYISHLPSECCHLSHLSPRHHWRVTITQSLKVNWCIILENQLVIICKWEFMYIKIGPTLHCNSKANLKDLFCHWRTTRLSFAAAGGGRINQCRRWTGLGSGSNQIGPRRLGRMTLVADCVTNMPSWDLSFMPQGGGSHEAGRGRGCPPKFWVRRIFTT